MELAETEGLALTIYFKDRKKLSLYEAYLLLKNWKTDEWGRELGKYFSEERKLSVEQTSDVVVAWLKQATQILFEESA